MARNLHMSWLGGTRRWMKMYRGKRYAISCRQLNVPLTKEDSWRAANAWWEAKQAELDAAAHPPSDTFTDNVVNAMQNGLGATLLDQVQKGMAATSLMLQLGQVVKRPLKTADDMDVAAMEVAEGVKAGRLPHDLFASLYDPFKDRWEPRVNLLLDGPTVPPDRTVGGQVDRWVATQQALAGAAKIKPDRADNNRICLLHFRAFLGESSALEIVNEEKLHDFFLHCLGKVEAGRRARPNVVELKKLHEATDDPTPIRKANTVVAKNSWSVDYAKKVFAVGRTFVRFLWESRLIELPRNIDSTAFRFGPSGKSVKTWTLDEFNTVMSKATGQMRLHLMLMANCGMLQTDISDLLDNEVDWDQGRIIRKRSKTAVGEDVPVVNYKLWPLTFELLKEYRSGGDVVLLTESGRRWVDKRLVEGRLVKADNIASCYTWLKKKAKFTKPLKLIRKTSASLIESQAQYGRYKSHFLGHSPRSIADRHYAAPSPELFDEIVNWLGKQYGFTN